MYEKCNINVFISCQSLGKLFTSPSLCFIICKTGMKTLIHGIVSIKGTTLHQMNTALWVSAVFLPGPGSGKSLRDVSLHCLLQAVLQAGRDLCPSLTLFPCFLLCFSSGPGCILEAGQDGEQDPCTSGIPDLGQRQVLLR